MISVTNLTEQTLQPGQSITFDNVVSESNSCAERFRKGSTAIQTSNGVFRADFNGNVGGTTAAAPVQLSVEIDGAPLIGSNMISTPAAVGDLNNVSSSGNYFFNAPRFGGSNVTVTNTGVNPIVVAAGSKLSVMRVGGC